MCLEVVLDTGNILENILSYFSSAIQKVFLQQSQATTTKQSGWLGGLGALVGLAPKLEPPTKDKFVEIKGPGGRGTVQLNLVPLNFPTGFFVVVYGLLNMIKEPGEAPGIALNCLLTFVSVTYQSIVKGVLDHIDAAAPQGAPVEEPEEVLPPALQQYSRD